MRNKWVSDIADLVASWRMANDLKDKRIIAEAAQNIILTTTIKRFCGKNVDFQYFRYNFPDKGWFAITPIFQQKGMLNTEYVCEEVVIPNQLKVIFELLTVLVEIYHKNVNSNEEVDFKQIKASKDFQTFLEKTSQLQRFALGNMASEELTVMFVYLYNTLVLHAYIEIEHFPTCIWDWRYLERTAFYTIGGVAYSLFDIHHGILRHNRLSPFGSDHPFVENDPRLTLLSNVADNPCTLFTLSDHTRFSPSMFKLDPASLDNDLREAAKLYCHEYISFKKNIVKLPILFKYYQEDLGGSTESVLCWLSSCLSNFQQKKLAAIMLDDSYEIEWLESWAPSPKLLVGAHHFSDCG